MRTFSLQEAQAMLPVLESLLRVSMEAKQTVEEVEGELESLQERIFLSGGTSVSLGRWKRRKSEREKAVQKAKDALGEITAIGVQVKDLDMGLLDFPCKVETGEVVLLCWKLGEPSITHWHGMEEGYAGRKLIDERIERAKPGQTN